MSLRGIVLSERLSYLELGAKTNYPGKIIDDMTMPK